MVDSCVEFVRHSNSIGRHADSLRCLKEILPSAAGIPRAELRVHAYLSRTYEGLKEYDDVILHAKKWIEIAQNMGDKETKGFGYQTMGDAFLSLACYDDALHCGKKCLEIAQETGSVKGEMMAYKCMMLAYSNMQKHDETILYAHKLLYCAMKANDKRAMKTACLELGRAHFVLKHYQDAIEFGTKCIEIAREIQDRSDEFSAYLLMGRIYSALSDHDNAIIYCKKCIDLAITIGDKLAEAAAYSLMGEVHYLMGKYDDAISNCNKCLHIGKEDKGLDVMSYFTIGRVNQCLEKYDKAIENYKQCIDIVDRIGREKKLAAKASLCLGEIYQTLGQYNGAVSYSKKCIDMAQETGEKRIEVQACLLLGQIYQTLEQYKDAVYYSKKCINMAQETGERSTEARACLLLGQICQTLGEYNDAVYYSKKYIDMAQETGERSTEARACLLLGQIYQTLGQYKDAVYYSKKCIDMAQETGEKGIKAQACLLLGQIYQTLEQYNDAVYYSKKCIDMAQETGDKQSEMQGYCLLARAYLDLNQSHDASLSIDAGMAIATGLGDKETEAHFKKLRSSLYATVGLFDNDCDEPLFKELFQGSTKSEDDLLEDLAQPVKTGDKMKRHIAYLRLYIFYLSENDLEKAILYLEQLKEMNVSSPVNLFCISAIGNSYQMMGQDDMALRCYEEGLPIAESCSVHVFRAKVYYNYSKLLISLKKELNLAERYLREAIRCFEAVFATLGSHDEFKISIFEEHIHSYKLLAFLLISGKQFEEALLVLDRCRARALKDLMMANYKMEQEESNDEHLEYRHDVLPLVSGDFSISFYSLCSDDLLMFFLERENNFHFSSSPNRSLQMHVDTLFAEMGVREVVNCEDRSLDKEQDIQKEQKRRQKEYEGLKQPTASLLDLDSKRGESKENIAETKGSTLEVLFDILECDKILSSKQDEVVVIPEGPLYKVPFPALRDTRTGKYLSETKRIRLAPSLATLKLFEDFPGDQTSNAEPLIIGSPLVGKVKMDGEERDIDMLFGALDEARDIAHILGVQPLVKAYATKTAVLEKLREGPSIVHIATYGILSKATIVLAPSPEIRATKIPDDEDYMLTMADVQQAQVRAQLVVLSCCHSGRGEIRAEGVVRMCRAFLASGARAVVASLWANDDEATVEFMVKFYFHLKDGKSASASLQEAMKQMRDTTEYSEPKYWAPFFLMGDDVTIKL